MKMKTPDGRVVEVENASTEWIDAVTKLGWEKLKEKRKRRTKAEIEADNQLDTTD